MRYYQINKSGRRFSSVIFFACCLTVLLAGCSVLTDSSSPFSRFFITPTATTSVQIDPDKDTVPSVNIAPESEPLNAPSENLSTLIPETTAIPTPHVYTLQLWVPPQFDTEQDTPGGKALQDAISTYQETHPNVNITLRVKASSGDSSMLNTITAANHIAQDVLPSLALMSRSDMETAVQRGLLQPYSTSVFSDSSSWYSYAKQSAVIDNTIYGIPLLGDGLVLTYRTAKVGSELTTWQDILTRGLPIGFAPSSSSSLFGTFIYQSNGGKFTNDQGALYLDQQKLTDTLNFYLSGGQNGAFPPSLAQLVDESQVWQRFNDGTMSIIVSRLSSFRHYQAAGMSAIPLPLPENTTDYPMVSSWNMVLLETDPALQQEAISFAEYLSEVSVNDNISVTAGYLPVRASEHEAWQNDPQFDLIKNICEHALLIPNNTASTKIIPIINTAISQVIRNQQTPEAAAQDAIASLN